jgi:hypothetical protein
VHELDDRITAFAVVRVMTELQISPRPAPARCSHSPSRRLVAEAVGTALLIVAVIGSGIMASRLSPDDVGLQLLENAFATAGALVGLILMCGAVSGAHFNPGRHPRRPVVRDDLDR